LIAFQKPNKRKFPTSTSKKGFLTMVRALRVEYRGAFYHVTNRGNAGDDIFKSLGDREKFLE
jgi:hypothetical protein